MSCPDLIYFNDYDGDWERYLDAVYKVYLTDIVNHALKFRGTTVSYKRHPETEGKSFGFWHIVQEGKIEDKRTPDFRRCERISWIRYIIENENNTEEIQVWENHKNRQRNTLLWFREEYLIILSKRNKVLLLKTAYKTDKKHRIKSLQKERDEYLNSFKG